MKECSKSIPRRLREPNFINKYFVGVGLDIGGKPDPLSLYTELFPKLERVDTWDIEDGDAQFLGGVADSSYDFAHSSHTLEHLHDPSEGLGNWFRVVNPGGYLILIVPDEDLYEQGIFPSTFNEEHKWTFTVMKENSWSSRSVNLLTLIQDLGPRAEIIKIELLDSTYRYGLPRYDQTLSPIGESSIEAIIRKRSEEEVGNGGFRSRTISEPSREMRVHLNQYLDDIETLKSSNEVKPPFMNDAEV